MLIWLLAGLGLYFAQIFLPVVIAKQGAASALGSRDETPEPGKYTGRAQRALANMKENLPFFLTLGVLSLIVEGTDMESAVLGAMIFVIARVCYVPLYLSGIPGPRTLTWLISLGGLGVMVSALL